MTNFGGGASSDGRPKTTKGIIRGRIAEARALAKGAVDEQTARREMRSASAPNLGVGDGFEGGGGAAVPLAAVPIEERLFAQELTRQAAAEAAVLPADDEEDDGGYWGAPYDSEGGGVRQGDVGLEFVSEFDDDGPQPEDWGDVDECEEFLSLRDEMGPRECVRVRVRVRVVRTHPDPLAGFPE